MIMIQSILVFLISFIAGLILFGAINILFDIDVVKNAGLMGMGASLWTILSVKMIELLKNKGGLQ